MAFSGNIPAFAWRDRVKPYSGISDCDSNLNLTTISIAVYCKSDTLDHATTNAGSSRRLPVYRFTLSEPIVDSRNMFVDLDICLVVLLHMCFFSLINSFITVLAIDNNNSRSKVFTSIVIRNNSFRHFTRKQTVIVTTVKGLTLRRRTLTTDEVVLVFIFRHIVGHDNRGRHSANISLSNLCLRCEKACQPTFRSLIEHISRRVCNKPTNVSAPSIDIGLDRSSITPEIIAAAKTSILGRSKECRIHVNYRCTQHAILLTSCAQYGTCNGTQRYHIHLLCNCRLYTYHLDPSTGCQSRRDGQRTYKGVLLCSCYQYCLAHKGHHHNVGSSHQGIEMLASLERGQQTSEALPLAEQSQGRSLHDITPFMHSHSRQRLLVGLTVAPLLTSLPSKLQPEILMKRTEIRTSISPSSAVELNMTSALTNYANEAGADMRMGAPLSGTLGSCLNRACLQAHQQQILVISDVIISVRVLVAVVVASATLIQLNTVELVEATEVELRISHSSLMSSDRMKPGSGDWAEVVLRVSHSLMSFDRIKPVLGVMIDFLHFVSGSNVKWLLIPGIIRAPHILCSYLSKRLFPIIHTPWAGMLPLQNLQQTPGMLNCSWGLHSSWGHTVSGSIFLQCMAPSRHSHSTHCFKLTDSPWSYITPRSRHCSEHNTRTYRHMVIEIRTLVIAGEIYLCTITVHGDL
uniref:(California timema) hypothetical protein n=1 Tax=Timema californicum TaxID=61474 RepID=A0A7R9J2V1_TIMCA|nr:unnamed protein product [Timema californicum]